jgi:hypothetical protein
VISLSAGSTSTVISIFSSLSASIALIERESSFSSVIVYLTDKGTRLLDESNPLHESMLRLIEKSEMTIAASESISYYEVSYSGNSKIVEQSARSIAEDITYLPNLLVLE